MCVECTRRHDLVLSRDHLCIDADDHPGRDPRHHVRVPTFPDPDDLVAFDADVGL